MDQPEPTAGLADWSLLRLTVSGAGTLHAVGIVIQHPHMAPGVPAVTTCVETIAQDRTWLKSANRIYSLVNERDRQPQVICDEIVYLICQATAGIAHLAEWLDCNGDAYLVWNQQDMRAAIQREADRRAKLFEDALAGSWHADEER